MKFAATILALALATTHGLLDEGDHNVQKKDASKGLRGSAVERAAVGRKLDFYHGYCPEGTDRIPDPRVCSYCSKENDPDSVFEPVQDCRFYAAISDCEDAVGGYSSCELFDNDQLPSPPSPIEGCDRETCRCCDGSLPVTEGDLTVCRFYPPGSKVCSSNPTILCEVTDDCPGTDTCEPVPEDGNPCFPIIDTPKPTTVPPTPKPTPRPTTTPPTSMPTPCPKKLDVCIAVDESGSVCTTKEDPGPTTPQLCITDDPPKCLGVGSCEGEDTERCDFEEGCPNFNNVDDGKPSVKNFVTEFINALIDSEPELDELQVSVVEFGTNAILTTGLTDADDAKAKVNGIAYSGGYTNLEQAIERCSGTLTSDDRSGVILAVTDGALTTFGDGTETCANDSPDDAPCKVQAREAATAAKYEGITLATAFVLNSAGSDPTLLEEIASSSNLAVEDKAFPDAGKLATEILKEVDLCTSN